jgi:ATP-dependent protease HslVU (ClpYQ) peptidase subunit
MTCIVGIKHAGKVYIGGDSLGSNYYSKTVRVDQKVFIKGEMLFGFTSSFRMGQIIQYSFDLPERDAEDVDDMKFLVNKFVPALTAAFDTGGYLTKKENVNTGGTFLLGYRSKLYQIQEDFQVGESLEDYDACGSGEKYALGSLYSGVYASNPKKRIELAIHAAEKFATTVGGPILVKRV